MHLEGERPRGFFLTLEGPEGSGKSTQARRLAARLEAAGRSCVVTREPGGTALGEEVRRILLHAAELEPVPAADALLFNAARAQLVSQVIRPALERGDVVICDRFADSTLAYQGFGAGRPLPALRDLARFATGGLAPELTVLIDLPEEQGLGRKAAAERTRFEEREDVAFHRRVRQGFLELAAQEPERFVVIDGRLSADAIEEAIAGALEARLAPRVGLTAGNAEHSGTAAGPAKSEPPAGSLRMER
jgi:dTMP kinase